MDREEFYFIEVNPRIQVEHTVTEVVTGIDLVRSQILIAQGQQASCRRRCRFRGRTQIETSGVAMQCRITTEDPENHFIPDYGRISTYRSPGGFAVRLDGGNGFGGAVITPYFDSLLVKMTTWGQTLEEAVRRTDRSLREFRIRGVKTNIAFLGNLILHPTFMSGAATTEFVDSTPELFRFRAPRDRATKILSYLGDVIVNGRPDVKGKIDRSRKLADAGRRRRSMPGAPPPGLRQKLQELGPEKFAEWVRGREAAAVHRHDDARRASVAAGDARAHLRPARRSPTPWRIGVPNLFSLEMWGGATFDTSMRFLQEDPWDRLVQLRARIPNILFQMLLRASNTVGYTNYPDNVVRAFIRKSGEHGIDVFRVFDSLNSTPNMKVAMDAVRTETDAICEAAICYTGDILDPARTKYSLKYYVKMAKELERDGRAHACASRTWPGLCKPYAAYALVKALRDEVDVPIHFHTHDTSGIQGASVLRAADAGVDIVDAAICVDERHDEPAVPELARRGAAPHAARQRARSGRARPAERLLGRRARALLSVRGRPEGAGGRRVSPRDAGRAVHQPAPAGQEPGPRRPLAGSLRRVRGGQPAARRHRQGDAVEQGRRRPGAVHGDEQPVGRRSC